MGEIYPLQGRFSYKMVKVQPTEVLVDELRFRGLPTWGRKDQLASRLYTALGLEGRALSSEESAVADAELGLYNVLSGASSNPEGSGSGSGEDGDSDSEASVLSGEVASSQELEANPLLALQSSPTGRFLTDAIQERIMSNAGNLQTFFLYGEAAPNGIKQPTSCVVRTTKGLWLFECGEDTQRHLSIRRTVAWGKLERIFISSLSPDNILGLPGMLCTISASRERGHEAADIPLHVYGPPGLADYINTMLTVSRTYLEMPVIIHEMIPGPVPAEQLNEPVQINPRSRLYVMRVPPDQLNPEGYCDAELRTLLSRHTRKKSNPGIDTRAGSLPLPLPPPGDPTRTGRLHVSDFTWTFTMDHEWVVQAAPLRNKLPTFGYLLQEADRAGKLYVKRAAALGVEPGEDFSKLKQGQSVPTADGSRIVQPSEVVGPARRGRRVAIISSCWDSSLFAQATAKFRAATRQASQNYYGSKPVGGSEEAWAVCDLVIHSMSYPAGMPDPAPARSAAAMAGATAAALCSKEVVLWQQQADFMHSEEGADWSFPEQVVQQAREALGSESVSLAGCYYCYLPERDEMLAPWEVQTDAP